MLTSNISVFQIKSVEDIPYSLLKLLGKWIVVVNGKVVVVAESQEEAAEHASYFRKGEKDEISKLVK
jgi:uncharacterized protein YlzI (FlbEa/FlbD family)